MRCGASLPLVLLVFTSGGDAYLSRHSTSLRTANMDKHEVTEGSRRTTAALRQLSRYIRTNTTGGKKENSSHEKEYWAALSNRSDDVLECDLCGGNQQWLFVLAKSRELSKPAVDILNALPGYHLKSAQRSRSAVESLRELHQVASEINERNRISDPAWKANPISENRLLCSLQLFARDLVVGGFEESTTTVIGFDEVRNASDENGTKMDFVSKLFPCARFVLRADEGMRGNEDDASMALLKDATVSSSESQSWQQRFLSNHSRGSFLLAEDYAADHFNSMLTWLGVEGCHFQEVQKPPLSVEGSSRAPEQATESADGLRLAQTSRTRVTGDCQTPRWPGE